MAITDVQMEAAYNLADWDAGGRLPLYQTGDKLYLRSEYNAAGQTKFVQNPYTVISLIQNTDGAGNLTDATGITAVGVTAADISTVGAANDTAAEWATFYYVQQDSQPSNRTVWHESTVLSLAGVNIIRDANDWV